MRSRTRLDEEVLELLAGEPELLAIADAFAETQGRRRRVRPVGVAAGVALLAAATVALVLWSSGGSSGMSGNVAYAAMGGGARVLGLRVGPAATGLGLSYDRKRGELTVTSRGRQVRVPAMALPPQATTVAPTLAPFGAGTALAVSLLTEYPDRAKAGDLQAVKRRPRGFDSLRWVSYRSSLGYAVQVGLKGAAMVPVEVVRAGGARPLRVIGVFATN